MTTLPPTVSIVVPTWNAEKTVGPLLDSLRSLAYERYEVIIVNDGSTDGTKGVVQRYPVKLIDQTNRGASAARDAGLRAASGEIIAFVDSDVTVSRDWLKHLVRPFADPTVAATTGQTIFRRNEKCAAWMRSLDIARRYSQRREYTRLANGPNSAFRRDVLLEVGGFNPQWYHAEDTEVSYRLVGRGYRIRYVPEAVVHHVPEGDWRDYLRKRYRDAKAFTRMLARYTRHAILEDDFVSLGMKVQPPLFLATLLLGILSVFLFFTPWGPYALTGLVVLVLVAVALNVPEAFTVARASRRVAFFFEGMALTLLRGFAWSLGLGVGMIQQATRTRRVGVEGTS